MIPSLQGAESPERKPSLAFPRLLGWPQSAAAVSSRPVEKVILDDPPPSPT